MIQLIRGFKDILPGEVELWQQIGNTAISLLEAFGFKEIRTPILERTELFARSIGEDTDIVEKEMYTFPDRKGELLTLRPEATASIVRSYIQHKLYAKNPVQKFYTIGPMFRRERPQKGRYRQFYQINAEVFGVDSALIDAQLIFLLKTLFVRLAVTDIQVHINSLGCPLCRPDFKATLEGFLSSVVARLCSDCNKRHVRNPLRVLDCKVPGCREALKGVPSILDSLCPACERHFESLKDSLERLNVFYVIDKRLVRGLDYYTRSTFEIKTSALGAQDAVAGGGRYDGLVKALGGPDIPATGFAIGFDRLAELTALNKPDLLRHPDIFVAALGENSQAQALEWTCALGIEGIQVEMDMGDKSLKSLMKRADKLAAKHVLIIGDRELEQGSVTLRNMKTQTQVTIPIETLVENIQAELKRS
jgi:histidyl-tRNA synthetase